jgi:hypothetical protein
MNHKMERERTIESAYKVVEGIPSIAAELEVPNGVVQLARSPA